MAKVNSKIKITASRNGVTRRFSKQTWDLLPEGKYGWIPDSAGVERPVAKASPVKGAETPKQVQVAAPHIADVNKD